MKGNKKTSEAHVLGKTERDAFGEWTLRTQTGAIVAVVGGLGGLIFSTMILEIFAPILTQHTGVQVKYGLLTLYLILSSIIGQAFVTRIVVSRDGFDWYLRFDGGPDKPLHCQLDGKRKQTTRIMVSGEISPTMDSSRTGCYQGRQVNSAAKAAMLRHGRFFVWAVSQFR